MTRQTDGAAGSFWIRTVLTGAEQHGKPAVVHHLPPSTKDPKTTMHCLSLFASLCPNKCKLIIQLQHSFVDAVLLKQGNSQLCVISMKWQSVKFSYTRVGDKRDHQVRYVVFFVCLFFKIKCFSLNWFVIPSEFHKLSYSYLAGRFSTRGNCSFVVRQIGHNSRRLWKSYDKFTYADVDMLMAPTGKVIAAVNTCTTYRQCKLQLQIILFLKLFSLCGGWGMLETN